MTQQAGSAQQKAMQQFLSRRAGQNQTLNYLMQLYGNSWQSDLGSPMKDWQRNMLEERLREDVFPPSKWKAEDNGAPFSIPPRMQPGYETSPDRPPDVGAYATNRRRNGVNDALISELIRKAHEDNWHVTGTQYDPQYRAVNVITAPNNKRKK